VILGAGKVPPHRQGSRVMRTLGYALALIAVGCSQQSRKLRNSNYELVDGHCTAACANGAIPGEDGASNPRREKVDMEVRTKHIVGRSVIPSFGTKKWASIDFPKAAETNRPPQPPARHAFQVSPLQKGTNGFVLLNLLLSANQLKVEHSRLSPFSTISSRPYPRRCDMLIPFQPTLSVVLNHNVPFDEQLRDHNAILNDYYNASEAANHSKRSVDFDRWFLPGWFNGYKVQDYHHPEGRQLFVWEALHPVIGFEIARVYSNALAVTRLKYRSSTSYLGRIKCLADFVCAPSESPAEDDRYSVDIRTKYNDIVNPISKYIYPPYKGADTPRDELLLGEDLTDFLAWIPESHLPSVRQERRKRTAERTYTQIILAAICGFRYDELHWLDALGPTRDIFPDRNTIRTRFGKAAKGSGPRTREVDLTPLSSATLNHYERYTRTEFPGSETNPALFLTLEGTRVGYTMARSALGTIVRHARAAGLVLPADMGWHSFRRSFATQYIQEHPDKIWKLLELLGHQDPLTLIRYVRPTAANLSAGMGRYLSRLAMARTA